MLYRSTAEVKIPAHKIAQFKKALIRHAPTEHNGLDLGHISAFELGREGANAIVRVLIDSTAHFDEVGEFADDLESGDCYSAANESIGYAIAKVGGDWDYSVETARVE